MDSAYRIARIAPVALQHEAQPRIGLAVAVSDGAPEKRLVLAVLLDAIGILSRRDVRRPGQVVAATRDWVLSDDMCWPYSFRNLCEALDIDPVRLRRRLTPQQPAHEPDHYQ